jgi:hypothetical protein
MKLFAFDQKVTYLPFELTDGVPLAALPCAHEAVEEQTAILLVERSFR